MEQQLQELTDGIIDLKKNRGENFSVKQLEKVEKGCEVETAKTQ